MSEKANQKTIGKVESVDTGNIIIKVPDEQILNSIQVNNLIRICSTQVNESIIGLVTKIMRKSVDKVEPDSSEDIETESILKVSLIGTNLDKDGTNTNIFKRTLKTIPSIDADCFLIDGDKLSEFMQSISSLENNQNPLKIGKYVISDDAEAHLDGNKFFQRHAVIVGSTGSGKSWTVANILEKASKLPSVNSIIFDIHGEYKPLHKLENITLLKIAGPTQDKDDEKSIFLPYWLLSYEEIESMLLDRSDQNAPNQARTLFDLIIKYKKERLKENNKEDILNNFTIDSPVPYEISKVLKELEDKDEEMVEGARSKKQGPLHGKLTRFIQRLKSKQSDKRLNFIFNSDESLQKHEWLTDGLINKLMNFNNKQGLKIIDFSEVPSDILPLVTGLIARLIFSVQQWTEQEKRHPIALFCDEAHLYIPADTDSSVEERGLYNFKRVAKEGRKYGVSLVIISQRPADVDKTVLSQCGNFISMRLSNPDDQNVIKRLFPDSLGNFADLLPILDIGESLIVGDACLLPSRIRIDEPNIKPSSATINFWDEWSKNKKEKGIQEAVEALRKQSK